MEFQKFGGIGFHGSNEKSFRFQRLDLDGLGYCYPSLTTVLWTTGGAIGLSNNFQIASTLQGSGFHDGQKAERSGHSP